MTTWVEVPVGLDAHRWATRPGCRTVLVLADTVASTQRLLDVIALLRSDWRVQVVFTRMPSVFGAGVERYLEDLGGVVLPWEQATTTRFDLALAAGTSGIDRVHAPLVLLPHGAGFTKYAALAATGAGPAPRQAFGLGGQELVRDGRVLPSALVLAHDGERDRLARLCPEALGVARVVGDPCADRIAASQAHRVAYRRALGLGARERLIVACSTWGASSLLGAHATTVARLVEETRASRWRVALLSHPNIWAGHGPWQVRAWLAEALRAGLLVVPPEQEWRAVLVAADAALGDHGSATLYAALTGMPVLLGGESAEVDPAAPMARLLAAAPRTPPSGPVLPALETTVTTWRPGRLAPIAARVTSAPGAFAARMRRLLYGHLRLAEPAHPARLGALPPPTVAFPATPETW